MTPQTSTRARRRVRDERGSISIWLVTSSFVMMMLVGLAVDLGGHGHAQQRVRDIAAQAARTAGEEIAAAPAVRGEAPSVDAVAARAAASRYLARAGVTGTVQIPAGTTLTVTVTDTYTPLVLTVIGIGPLRVSGQATARLVRAVDGAEG